MRILQVIGDMHPRSGGPPSVVNGLSLALKARGDSVEIAARMLPGEEAQVRANWPLLESSGIPLHLFPATGPRQTLRSTGLADFARKHAGDFDAVHFHGAWEGVMPMAARHLAAAGTPYLISSHGLFDRWSMAKSAWKKRLSWHLLGTGPFVNGASGIVFGSEGEAKEATRLGLKPPAFVVPNGIVPRKPRTEPDGAEGLRTRFPETRGWKRTILFFSRFHPKKGLDVLVEAFGRVAGDFPDAGIFAAGIAQDAAFEARVRERVASLGLGGRIVVTNELVGRQARVAFDIADIFALTSHQEGFSMAIVEAMSEGLPVLITDACHLDHVQPDGAGVVTKTSVDSVEHGLRSILSKDDAELALMGRTARQVANSLYSWNSVAGRMQAIYSEIGK